MADATGALDSPARLPLAMNLRSKASRGPAHAVPRVWSRRTVRRPAETNRPHRHAPTPMKTLPFLTQWLPSARRASVLRIVLACMLGFTLVASPRPAQAADGCQVLLCFAAPNWRAIPQCVPTINQVLRDLALGRGFPI